MHRTIQDTPVPALGFATYKLKGDECRHSVTTAIETGYRHIDTARAYDNEAEVGAGIAESGVPRNEIFLTSKVWFDDLEYDPLMREIDASLRALRTDFLDLAQGAIHDNEVLQGVARRHDATPEQISLAWLLEQPNVAAIPRSSSADHIRSNFRASEIRLDDEDRRKIDELPGDKRQIDPEFAPAWGESTSNTTQS